MSSIDLNDIVQLIIEYGTAKYEQAGWKIIDSKKSNRKREEAEKLLNKIVANLIELSKKKD